MSQPALMVELDRPRRSGAPSDVEPAVPVRTALVEPRRRLPLVVTADPLLLDDVVRLAAVGATEVQVATDAVAARSAWLQAPFVLLGTDAVASCARSGLPPRGGVMVVSRSPVLEPAWAAVDAVRAELVAVLPAAEEWLAGRFAGQSDRAAERGRVIGVVGGCIGAGATVLAGALAVTARRRGLDALLIDAEPDGVPGGLTLGWGRLRGGPWTEQLDSRGRLSPPALVEALPGEGSLATLSFGRPPMTARPDAVPPHAVSPDVVPSGGLARLAATSGLVPLEAGPPAAMAASIDAGRRGRDLVVIDLPRHIDEGVEAALAAADRVYLVVPADAASWAAARRVAHAVLDRCCDLGLVVRGPAPGGFSPIDIADSLRLPLVGILRSETRRPGVLGDGAPPAGTGRGPLARLARELLADVGPRPRWAATR